MGPAIAAELMDDTTRLSAAAPSTRVNMMPPEIHSHIRENPNPILNAN